MSNHQKCARCGFDPHFDACPHCGHPSQITTQDEKGDLVMVCCRKPLHDKKEVKK